MRNIFYILIALCSIMFSGYLYSYPAYSSVEKLVEDINNVEAEPTSAKRVQSYMLELDYGELTLDDGLYYQIKPFNDRICAGLFVGNGYFDFQIPKNSEISSLMNILKVDRISSEIEWAIIFSGDSLAENLGKPYQADSTKIESYNYTKYFRDYFTYINKKIVGPVIAMDLLNGNYSDLKIIVVKTAKFYNPFIYVYSSDEREEVGFYRGQGHTLSDYMETLCLGTRKNYDAKADTTLNNKDYFIADKYNINLSFSKTYKMAFDVSVDFTALKPTNKWIYGYLFERANIKEILLNGEKLDFYIDENFNIFFVNLKKTFNKGEKFSLRFIYDGVYTRTTYNGHTYFKESAFWYPFFNKDNKSIFDIKAQYYGAKTKFISVGDEIEHKEVDDIIYSHWVTPEPLLEASYFICTYSETNEKAPTGEDITIIYDSPADLSLFKETVKNSIKFYSTLYGKMPFKKIYFAQGTYNTLNAFPGLIQIGWYSSSLLNTKGYKFAHIPFSISYEWLLYSANSQTYRDDWITNGLAYYSSLLYALNYSADIKVFDRSLEFTNEVILRSQSITDGKYSQIAGLGYRNDYIEKSAMIFHMLRMLLIDNKTNDESLFLSIIKEFYTNYKGKLFSSDDFINIVNKQTGMDFKWFFEQWVNTSYIPSYKYALKTEILNGKYVIKVKIKQEKVPGDFAMLVPISLKNDDKQVCHYRAFVTGLNSVEFSLPAQDKKPDDIIFNPGYSVLCETDEVNWEDL